MRILVVQIPAQTAEDVLTRFEDHIELAAALLAHPVDIALHIPLRVASADDRNLSLEQLRKRFLPLMRAGRMAQTRVEEHEAIQVGIEGAEVLGLVHGVEVVNVGSDLHLAAESVLHDSAEGILGCALGQREFSVPVCHTLRSNEDEVQHCARVHVLQLQPDGPWEGGLSAGAENEDSHGGSLQAETFHVDAFTGLWRVERVAESWRGKNS